YDSEKWSHRKVTRISSTAETTNNAALFVDGGIQMTDSVSNNASVVISKKTFNLSRPMRFKCRFETAQPYWQKDAHAYISFLLGQNNVSTMSNGAKWDGAKYGNDFGTWSQGLDLVWDANYGSSTLCYSYHRDDGKRATAAVSESFLSIGGTTAGATFPPQKEISADLVWNPSGSFKFIASVGAKDRSIDGRAGYRVWNGLDGVGVEGYDAYSNFTNRNLSIGVSASCREGTYAAITLKELKVLKMNAAVGGNVSKITVPAGASSSVKAGEAVEGQTLPVVTIGNLDLETASSLAINPERASTKVNVGAVTSDGASIVAAEGSTVVLEGDCTFESGPESVGLTLVGNIVFGDDVSLTIPASWKEFRGGPVVVLDGSEMAGSLSLDVSDIVVKDANGAVDPSRYILTVSDSKLLIDFRNGLSVVIR
ncbi:MAG: hypothetical protein IJC66_10420, partial [Kiritimatiellae bacterium]|nr:hypothetical protein [Kiritimatiellia bacterium]